ncbi:MAG TPA: plasma-membrane proton-efflux P-type ATPase [Candidatus Paceibacterota bacterium]
MPDCIVFDLDSTLAKSKQPIEPAMAAALTRLLACIKIAVISGGKLEQLTKQVADRLPPHAARGNLFLLPTSGAALYAYRTGTWTRIYQEALSPDEAASIRAALLSANEETHTVDFGTPAHGERIEFRGSQVSFSALGQEAPLAEKLAWDPTRAKREALRAALAPRLPGFEVRIGGTTTIDITKKGIDKAYGVRRLSEHLHVPIDRMEYVGDQLYEGGNDAVVTATGIPTHAVTDPTDTLQYLTPLLARAPVAPSQGQTGLTTAEARLIREKVGANVLEEARPGVFGKFVSWTLTPISLMLLAAAALSFAAGKIPDGWLTLFLFAANFGIRLWHEGKADHAIAKLQENLAVSCRVERDGDWQKLPATELVPGDLVMLSVGAIVPADATVLTQTNLSLNESMLTGESLPRERERGETLYSGSFVATGNALALITATGTRTYFGKTLASVEHAKKRSALETDILSISRFLSIFSLVAIAILSVVLLQNASTKLIEIATLDLSLLIAGIPVTLPTVMSLIISVGVLELAKQRAAVRRLSSLEDLANVDLLLTDKTGTLTENRITVDRVLVLEGQDERDVLELAVSATDPAEGNALEDAVITSARAALAARLPQSSFTPGDSERKRSTAIVTRAGVPWVVTLGAPSTVRALCDFRSVDLAKRFDEAVAEAAARGDRALAVAAREGAHEAGLRPIGLLFLADTLRADAKETIAAMRDQGITVKMLTGDDAAIARQVSHTLGLEGDIASRTVFDSSQALDAAFEQAAGFANVLPEDKYLAVEQAKKSHVVAVTGDGVNDVPPVKAADVGIAVKNAVDALRSTADIVLLTNGIAVVQDAIIEARKVFSRVYHYSVYRISESSRLILTIGIIGVVAGDYPLTPIQIILLALLNDIPIVSLAFDRVHAPRVPATIDVKRRFLLGTVYGFTGVLNSVLMLWLALSVLHLPWPQIQTLFFLKLVVSGHLLIYIAHTDHRWFRFLPSWQVITAVTATQLLATAWALSGLFTAAIPFWVAAFVWVWAFFWMQTAELGKMLVARTAKPKQASMELAVAALAREA